MVQTVYVPLYIFSPMVDWINQHRARKGWQRVQDLPEGICGDTKLNPISKACQIEIFDDAQLPKAVRNCFEWMYHHAARGYQVRLLPARV